MWCNTMADPGFPRARVPTPGVQIERTGGGWFLDPPLQWLKQFESENIAKILFVQFILLDKDF